MGLFDNKEEKLREKLRHTEKELKEKQERLKKCIQEKKAYKENMESFFESGILPMIIVDEKGEVKRANSAVMESLEADKTILLNSDVNDIFEDITVLIDTALTEGKKVHDREISFEIDQDRTKHFLISIIPLENGRLSRALVILKDITEKEGIREELEESKNRNETLIENAPLSISITDLEDNILFANEYMADKFGYSKEKLEGKNFSSLMSEEQWRKLRQKTKNRKDGVTESYELTFEKKDGTPMEMLVTATPFEDIDGNIVKTVGYFQEITEMKKLHREQEEAKKYL
ncbi:MAG: PAS domain-containing protein, partial [Candidatus Natronoplasma sp.]